MVQLNLVECLSGNCGDRKFSSIFSDIDKKLYKYSKLEYNNTRLFLKRKVDCENCDKFSDLVFYKNILVRKLMKDDCLYDISVDDIIHKIKQLTS